MGEKGTRGVSPVVGTILLIAITVALAAVVATLVSGLGGRGTPPSAMLTVSATISGDDITLRITHEGGDDLVVKDLQVKASNDNLGGMATLDLLTAGIPGTTFNVGEAGTLTYTAASGSILAGDTITVFVIHTPSKQKLYSSSSVVVR